MILIYQKKTLLACAGLRDCQEGNMGEIYMLAVAKAHQNTGLSTKLLQQILVQAKVQKFKKIFALTKHGAGWFIKNDFIQKKMTDLPKKRQALFNLKRNSYIYFKDVN
jgi:amino-acid N-acetyltransferase